MRGRLVKESAQTTLFSPSYGTRKIRRAGPEQWLISHRLRVPLYVPGTAYRTKLRFPFADAAFHLDCADTRAAFGDVPAPPNAGRDAAVQASAACVGVIDSLVPMQSSSGCASTPSPRHRRGCLIPTYG